MPATHQRSVDSIATWPLSSGWLRKSSYDFGRSVFLIRVGLKDGTWKMVSVPYQRCPESIACGMRCAASDGWYGRVQSSGTPCALEISTASPIDLPVLVATVM